MTVRLFPGRGLKALGVAFCFLGAFFAGSAPAAAQGAAAEIEALLASDAVTYAQAARFVLDAADAATFDDPAEAFGYAMERGWLPGNASQDAPARLDGVALLLMRSFGLPGGIMFTLTGSAHFAYREMEHMRFIHGRVSPRQRVSGEALLYLTGRVLAHMED